jgi:superfamily II DNA/RNA helicase
VGASLPIFDGRVRAQNPECNVPSFLDLGVPAILADQLKAGGITDPYPIQVATLADGLAGKDLFAQSPTGSGKTLAFAIPMIARIERAKQKQPQGLVLAPTRELAAQIAAAAAPLAEARGMRVACFYGGTGYKEQLTALRRGVDVVVGCPGRLIDLLERGVLDLRGVKVAVIDEADRMADMGFLPPVRKILGEIVGRHQTLLFSATQTKDVERLVRDYQHEPARHIHELPAHDVSSRSHEFWSATKEKRVEITAALVAAHSSSIVFCRTRRGVDRLAHSLSSYGVPAVVIHGDRSQAQRDRALAQFRSGNAQVLIGTDVASRGLHVDGVDCVVHFDPPEDDDTYVHRSGRTGRAGSSGRVVSLITNEQELDARKLQGRLGLGNGLQTPEGIVVPDRTSSAAPAPARPRSGGAPSRGRGGSGRSSFSSASSSRSGASSGGPRTSGRSFSGRPGASQGASSTSRSGARRPRRSA